MPKTNCNSLSGNLRYDLPSSLVVFLVALPLCLGIALASGAPLFSGLIAGVVGGIVVGLVSKSAVSISGPAAGLSVIVLSAIQELGAFETFLMAVVLTGFFQLLFGLLRAGVIGDFIPSSVIKGMLAAIGLILILKQIPHAVGYDKDHEGDFAFWQADGENTFSELLHLFQHTFTPTAIIISLLSIVLLVLWERPAIKKHAILQYVPGPLLVVILGIGMYLWSRSTGGIFGLGQEHLVTIPAANSFSEFASQFTFPDFGQIGNKSVWITAITIAIVASLESLLSIEAADRLDPFRRITPTNRELIAQGVGNMMSGAIGGIPVTSVIVRTSANVNAGGRTQMSSILHGLWLLLAIAFIPRLLNLIPLSALAAILLTTGFKLTKPKLFMLEWKKGLSHFIPFVATILAILFTDLLVGIVIGSAIGIFFVVRNNFKSAVSLTGEDGRYLLRLKKDMSFLHKSELKKQLEEIPTGSYVFVDATQIEFIDKDNVEILNDFIDSAPLKEIQVEIKRVDYQGSAGIKNPVTSDDATVA